MLTEGPPRRQIEVGPDPCRTAATIVLGALGGIVAARERARLAVPGGETPVPLFRSLAERTPPELYERLRVTLTDERHPDGSNARQVEDLWFGPAGRRPALFLPMTSGGDLAGDLGRFRERFEVEFGSALDVVVLGVGADGHVASLFPDHPALEAAGSCAAVTGAPKPPPDRLTLGLAALERASLVVVLATGPAKAAALERARRGDPGTPLGRLRPRGDYVWCIDEAAAGRFGADLK